MPGKFIVIEGTDGSGKGTQHALLIQRLVKEGHRVRAVDFPRYGQPSAYFVEKYLTGAYGGNGEVGPKRASLFYALDRFDASPEIKRALEDGNIVVANRYVASNMGHQGAKVNSEAERKEFFDWVYDLEYGILEIPKPTLNIFLHVPAKTAYELVTKKAEREYLKGGKKDIHETDIKHLEKAEATYQQITKLFPGEFVVVECAPEGELLPTETIHELIWAEVKKHI